MSCKMSIKESDIRLLNVLIENPRKSYRELAKEAKLSIAIIGEKLKKLESSGILKGYTSLVDYDLLGYEIQVVINIRVAHGEAQNVEKKIFNNPNVMGIYNTTGDFDVLVIARFKSRKELDEYIKNLQGYEFVERTQTQLILNTIKERPIKIL